MKNEGTRYKNNRNISIRTDQKYYNAGDEVISMKLKPARLIPMPKINHELREVDLYTETGATLSREDDEISLEEEAFMLGYLNA
jgi:hypothetical protein